MHTEKRHDNSRRARGPEKDNSRTRTARGSGRGRRNRNAARNSPHGTVRLTEKFFSAKERGLTLGDYSSLFQSFGDDAAPDWDSSPEMRHMKHAMAAADQIRGQEQPVRGRRNRANCDSNTYRRCAVPDLFDLVTALRERDFADRYAAFAGLRDILGDDFRVKSDFTMDDTEATVNRFIITTREDRSRFTSELSQQCNGVILAYPAWNVVSVPPPMPNLFITRPSQEQISKGFIHAASDGTVVTLYWFDPDGSIDGSSGGWCMSTKNGIDVSGYRWLGDKTYKEALQDIFDKTAHSIDYAALKHNECYSFCFTHPAFHPLGVRDRYDLRFVQMYSKTTGEYLYGLPTGIVASEQTEVLMDLEEMMQRNREALDVYLTGGPAHFGYMSRGSFAVCGSAANMLLESSLLGAIRRGLYNMKADKRRLGSGAGVVGPGKRVELRVLNAWLVGSRREQFKKLFPRYEATYKRLDAAFTAVLRAVMARLIDAGGPTVDESLEAAQMESSQTARTEPSETARMEPLEAARIGSVCADLAPTADSNDESAPAAESPPLSPEIQILVDTLVTRTNGLASSGAEIPRDRTRESYSILADYVFTVRNFDVFARALVLGESAASEQ